MLFSSIAKIIKINKSFFIAYHILLLAGIYFLLAYDKVSIFLFINHHHYPFLDRFFYYFTHLGSGITYCLLIAGVGLAYHSQHSHRLFLLTLGMGSFVSMSAIVQFLKRVIFPTQLRPTKLIRLANEMIQLNLVDNVTVLTELSFPSGHAGTIFTAAYFLNNVGPWRRRNWYSLSLLIVAVLVAYSRIYLCQHFYVDVYIGALIGGWSAILIHALLLEQRLLQGVSKKLSGFFKKIFLKYVLSFTPYLLIACGACIAFLPGLGSVHLFDWDEINFAEAAREMLVTHNYTQVQINFEPFYEKPPLFFWLQVISMKIWGINEIGARFPNTIFGIFTLWTIYYLGNRERGKRFTLFWTLLYFGSLLPHFYFKTGIIDPVFNYFMLVGFYCIVKLYNQPSRKLVIIGGLSLGFAVLTKGPVGYLLPCLPLIIYILWRRKFPPIILSNLVIGIVASLALPLAWLGYETYQHGGAFVKAFLNYQIDLFKEPIAGHGQPFYYHFVVVFLGCLPASILALPALWKINFKSDPTFQTFMQLLFWGVMSIFSIVSTKIIHYSAMSYFPLTFLAAHTLYNLDQNQRTLPKKLSILLPTIGTLMGLFLIGIPLAGLYRSCLTPYITDSVILGMLSLPVAWRWMDTIVGISYIAGTYVAYYYFKRKLFIPFLVSCSFSTVVCLSIGTQQIAPKIEAHLQRPVLEWYKGLANQQVYITTIGFKSYAPLFYARQTPYYRVYSDLLPWLLTGEIDQPAYFILKITDLTYMNHYKTLQLIKMAGGFCLFRREAKR